MLVWLASFPRSGNTFLRIVLSRLYDVPASVIYDYDGVADRLGPELIGAIDRPASLDAMRGSDQVHLIKTHRPRDADVHDDDRAICLVRDGRDALVSWARQLSEDPDRDFRTELTSLIAGTRGTRGWGVNVLSWLDPPVPHRFRLRYEDLIRDPAGAAARIVATLDLPWRLVPGATIPTFAELHATDPGFFRRGHTGTHRDELPDDLHDLFWSHPENATAMTRLGPGFCSGRDHSRRSP
ncbi:sulfotransferase domain-containing protein [Actinoplanes bogorensis]|uniref:Sulfotransferase domain-containing protein n=1 Tax=Paractinoplanes bogorensis TaxID=1610840 RepID=A0ABS5Z1V0_9ACTN|nr:sulfotransferase [Actinoplanes bogorensis]MBU2669671.1 sulfotransferase domain-containing protein [Actinoplanes bogorensis]